MLKKCLFSLILLSTVLLGTSAFAASFKPESFDHKSKNVVGSYVGDADGLIQLSLNKDGTAFLADEEQLFIGSWKSTKGRIIATAVSSSQPVLGDADAGVGMERGGFLRVTLELEARDRGALTIVNFVATEIFRGNPNSPGRIVFETREPITLHKVVVNPADLK